jgi:hypothetical protein
MSLKDAVRAEHEKQELQPWVYVGYRLIGDVRNNTYRLVSRYVRRIFHNGEESQQEYFVRKDFSGHKQALEALLKTPKQLTPEEVNK